MKGKKFFNTLAAKILVIALMLAATAGLVLGIFFLARPLNSGVRIGDALKGFSYEQTTAFGEKLAMDAINGVSEKDESLLFEKQGEYDGKQTVDITQLNAGIGCKSKNPATTYTLADLASMYNEGSQYEDFSGLFEDDGETDASYIEAQINDYGGGEVFYKDSQGNLYGSDYTLREFQDLDISMYMYRLTLDGDVVDIQQVEHVSLDDPTEIGINEVVIRLMLEEAGVDREMLDALDYSALDPSFAELYVRGRQYETKLPQSGETLGEYALQNPDKENLSGLYNSLLEAEARVGEYVNGLSGDSHTTGGRISWYYYESFSGNVQTNNPEWEGLDFETLTDRLVGGEGPALFGVYNTADWTEIYPEKSEGTVDYSSAGTGIVYGLKNYAGDAYGNGKWIVAMSDDAIDYMDYNTQQDMSDYESYRTLVLPGLIMTIGSSILWIVCFVISIIQAGRRDNTKTRYASLFAREMPIEVLLVIDIILWVIIGVIFGGIGSTYYPLFSTWQIVFLTIAALCFVGLFLWQLLTVICKGKSGNLLKNSIIRGIVRKGKGFARKAYENRKATGRIAICYVIFIVLTLICLGFCVFPIGPIMLIALWILTLILLLKKGIQHQKVKDGIHEIAGGNLDYQIDVSDLTGGHMDMANDMNNVREGMRNAIQEQMKSERLKTDLITNVSHDIKTPLTSIINYVDILKREDIQDEKIRGYIDILDRKSQRLKHLTEDLVEASKISSGNIQLNIEEINLKQLLKQTNGEFEEKFQNKDLTLVCTLPENQMLIRADGRRMWRVIENLYNNAAKYAMPHTRVYVDGAFKGGKVVVSIKNISEYPLNFSAEELMERFVRGDVSRSTEGSGLGLEIARNLTLMQNGTFDIYLDGDLFKVTITFDAI